MQLPKLRGVNDLVYVEKGWGFELIICNTPLYCGKILGFLAQKKLSWHKHLVKDEHFFLQDGLVRLYYGTDDDIKKAEVVLMSPGDSFHVEPGLRHRIEAIEQSHVFEFSTHHRDEDSIRIEKGD